MTRTLPTYTAPETVDGRLRLQTALGRRGVNEDLLSGDVPDVGWSLNQHDIDPLPRAFRMMVNERAFHVAEMPLTTLAMAVEHGRPMIGIPAVLNRDFHHRSIVVRTGVDITDPRQLKGRRVGVRAYSQTTGVWVRGMLHDEFGVDAASVTWVVTEGSHVEEFSSPDNVEMAAEGESLPSLMTKGEIDAAIIMGPDLDPSVAVPLFPDAAERAARAYASDGIYPVNHVLAVDTDLLTERPQLADELYSAFLDSRAGYLRRVVESGPSTAADRHVLALGEIVGGDPNPYGITANLSAIQRLLEYAHHQGLLRAVPAARDLFVASEE